MSWSANKIAAAISRQILQRKCIVLVDNCNWTGYECDILGVTTDRRIIDIEVKISRADLKADAKKTKWWEQNYLRNPDTGRFDRSKHHRDHPPKVWKHYYALPVDDPAIRRHAQNVALVASPVAVIDEHNAFPL